MSTYNILVVHEQIELLSISFLSDRLNGDYIHINMILFQWPLCLETQQRVAAKDLIDTVTSPVRVAIRTVPPTEPYRIGHRTLTEIVCVSQLKYVILLHSRQDSNNCVRSE